MPRTSDHSALVLQGSTVQREATMFRFDNYLACSHGFLSKVANVWQNNIYGTMMYSVTRKLKLLKSVFRQMRKEKGDLATNVKLASEFWPLSTKLEQNMLRQWSKLQWLKGGDQCTRLFFRNVAARRTALRVFQINNSRGELLTSPRNEFVGFYEQLLGGTHRWVVVQLDHLRPWTRHLVTEEEGIAMLQQVSRDEIKIAFFDIAEDKAPGPDGYSSGFFKAAWPIVGEEMIKAIMEFFHSGKILKQLNATLITLIPKVQLPSNVAEYRPISCCNVLYKVITKILVQRMKIVMNMIVSTAQNAFMPGRKICDNIMFAQELFSGYNQKHLSQRCALKVDLRKAYDSVEWDFLFASLRMFRFPERFVCWIEECVTTASFSVCLNGEPHGFFFGSRGLRQGDPMSPYLFVLCMEVFHLQMHKNIMESTVFQFHWRCRELELFSLCFADDLFLFCRADVASVLVFKEGLDWYSGVSGLQANPDKSQLILSKSAEHLRPCLHQDGLTYWSASFVLAKGVIKLIEKKMRKFLWQGTSDHGYAKVAWSQVCLPYDEGGQGIRAITPANQALMIRHLWDVLHHSPQSIWVQWIWQYRIRSKSIWTVSLTSGSWSWRKMIKLRHLLLNDIRGPSVTGVPLDARLDVVMHDEQWHWLPITNLEMLDITDDLPPIHSGPSRIRWNISSGTLTNSDALHLFQPKGPKVDSGDEDVALNLLLFRSDHK
ncbi:hypothetical protein Sango_3019800 [Sesamum angolense]|uniref:Reverse transcriptase domain-containing protein n=1 Tax=Sesamum angolense TaxID=2727404 RepID=A0AAE1T3B4_9LAMI|nr:hypothetical protein Sango_3019800 [Sesamum angolense]